MISWSRTLSVFLLPADSADSADVVYTETLPSLWAWQVRDKTCEANEINLALTPNYNDCITDRNIFPFLPTWNLH